MAGGGFVQLPDGSVIVALTMPVPPRHARTHAGPGTGPAGPQGTGEAAARTSGPGRQPRRGGPHDGAVPERRRWSAHADEPRPVRPAAARVHTDEFHVRVLVHSVNRARALTRLRNLGLRSVYLRGNAEPPTADEITAVLHHPEGLVWRTCPGDDRESWHPIASLLHPSDRVRAG